ncbi:helix-turn-helix domain-containing protein [Halobacillus salinarum]|uniref:Helix-turn-helix domain-containing protein n=1 Tax=Halobacillus salinarum TaxID=2932257 RepID=A0ABY4EFU7_9BACI|nr:helix-turn-helix transcriptional regulator [Halobacillus salinarum]UOQ43343.1 helix-turn-helix domain-containing protein [Halobacillus salinarum]
MYIKSNFKQVLLTRGISQTELGKELNVSPQQMNNWVNGRTKPRIETLFYIASLLECKVDELYKLVK